MSGHLYIIGCGITAEDLPRRHRETVQGCAVLAGTRRLLDWFPEFRGRRVELGAGLLAAMRDLAELARENRVAVLASGDPLFFGIANRFGDLLPKDRYSILPNITAAQYALAALHLPWAMARFFSVHGRDAALPWRQILSAAPAVIYGDAARNPAVIARELISRFPQASQRKASMAEDLGGNERYRHGTLAELTQASCGGLSLLVIHPPSRENPIDTPPLPLGLPDDIYAHERNVITHPEVRAIVLSKLRMGPGVLWDLGAGSGSVAVEACGLTDGLTAYAVEKESARAENIRQNAVAAGTPAVHVVENDILAEIETLPAPRAVFAGGGGRDIGRIASMAFSRLRPGGRLVVSAVLLDTKSQLEHILGDYLVETLEVEIRRATPVAHSRMMKPDNPITLYVYEENTQ